MLIHVAGAGRGSFNHRFAQASRDAQPTNTFFYPTDIFPFAYISQTDPVTGQMAGLLDRAVAGHVVPENFLYQHLLRILVARLLAIYTSPDGRRDLPLLDNVRIYFLAGLQHFSSPFPPERDKSGVLLASTCRTRTRCSISGARFSPRWTTGCATTKPRPPVVIQDSPTRYSLGATTR